MSDLKTICLDNECMDIKSESSTPWLVTKVDNTNGHYRRYSDGHFEMWGSVGISSGSYSKSPQGIFFKLLSNVQFPYQYVPSTSDFNIFASTWNNMYVTGAVGEVGERYDNGNMYYQYFQPAIHSLYENANAAKLNWYVIGSF